MTSVAASGGGTTVVLAERWRREAAMPAAAVVQLPARRDRATLERELASLSICRSW
jgi:hypothetical protein